MEDDGFDRDARVAGQGVAEVAELPAGLAVDEQDAGLVVGDLDRSRCGGRCRVGCRLRAVRSRATAAAVPTSSERDAEGDDGPRRGRRPGARRSAAWARRRPVERHGDLLAGVAVELERGLDLRDVALVDRLGRLDRGDRRVAGRTGRADQDGIDGDAPGRQPIDGRQRVARARSAGRRSGGRRRAPAASAVARLSASASAGCQSVVTARQGRRAGRVASATRPGRRSVAGAVVAGEGEGIDGMLAAIRAIGASLAVDQPPRDLAARQAFDRLAGAQRRALGQPRRSSAGRPGSAVAMLSETSTATITRPRTDSSERPGGDRLEQGEHQHRRRRQAEHEQAEAGPPRDQPPLLAVEDQQQDQGQQPRRRPRTRPAGSPPAAAAALRTGRTS